MRFGILLHQIHGENDVLCKSQECFDKDIFMSMSYLIKNQHLLSFNHKSNDAKVHDPIYSPLKPLLYHLKQL